MTEAAFCICENKGVCQGPILTAQLISALLGGSLDAHVILKFPPVLSTKSILRKMAVDRE